MTSLETHRGEHVGFAVADRVATITLNRPDKKNPLTFESYAELLTIFRAAIDDDGVKAFVITGAGGNFSSGGDVFEIIGPLIERDTKGLLAFTTMTGNLVKAMRACPQPIVAAIDGICAGAGAILAMASDMRIGTAGAKVAFLFNRVGLAGCDMGACAMLPRIVGQGRAAELLFTGRSLGGEEGERWGFFNRLAVPGELAGEAAALAKALASGPTFGNARTKRRLDMEWAMSVNDAIEAEAVAQALAMTTEDFGRAYRAFAEKKKPVFEGN
jgi:enoyl-CoA hydratase/carnithine racemase